MKDLPPNAHIEDILKAIREATAEAFPSGEVWWHETKDRHTCTVRNEVLGAKIPRSNMFDLNVIGPLYNDETSTSGPKETFRDNFHTNLQKSLPERLTAQTVAAIEIFRQEILDNIGGERKYIGDKTPTTPLQYLLNYSVHVPTRQVYAKRDAFVGALQKLIDNLKAIENSK